MNNKKLTSIIPFLATVVAIVAGCGEKMRIPPPYDEASCVAEIVGGNETKPAQLKIDVYLDATESMKGYAIGQNCVFEEFLRKMESVGISEFTDAVFRYHKFGTRVVSIERNDFLSAGYASRGFYDDKLLNTRTYLDSVVSRTDISSLSIIITDLFPENRDINSIAEKIKEYCLKRGLSVGLLGIKSQFDGMIYDASGPAYYYKSKQGEEATYRPFYVIFCGNVRVISQFLDRLTKEKYISEKNALIVSRYRVSEFSSKLIYDSKELMLLTPQANVMSKYTLRMGKDKKSASLALELSYLPLKFTEPFNPERTTAILFRKDGSSGKNPVKDSVLCGDLKVQSVAANGTAIRVDAVLTPPEQPNWYSYLVFFSIPLSDINLPDWVSDFSAKIVSARENPNKTLNLTDFVESLIVANHTIQTQFRQPTFIGNLNFIIERK